jgi:aminoglycoside phosphotransferase (APT) family kinase protein
MSTHKMHAGEVDTDASLVARLVAAQFPAWAELPIEAVRSAGTDNAIYRLGTEMAVRLPRVEWAAAQVNKEQTWLARLGPRLPLAIPVPLAKGTPALGYPWHWSVYRWLEGETATLERIADACQAALELARFVAALEGIDPAGGPAAGAHSSFRGVPLAQRDAPTRAALVSLHGVLEGDELAAAKAAWNAALEAPTWEGTPVWIHGDLQSGNLLAVQGRLVAVIDFGCLCVGDPACDLAVAWNLFDADARNVFREALAVDDATWARGRGWALSIALIALPYYRDTNRVLADIARHAITEVLADIGESA